MDTRRPSTPHHNRSSVHGVHIIEQDVIQMRTQSNIKHTTFITNKNFKNHSIVQVASHQPVITVAQIKSQASSWETCGGQNWTGTGFSPCTFVSPISIVSLLFHAHIYIYISLTLSKHGKWQHHFIKHAHNFNAKFPMKFYELQGHIPIYSLTNINPTRINIDRNIFKWNYLQN